MIEPSSLSASAFADAVDALTPQQKTLLRMTAAGHSTKAMLRLGVTLREGTIDNYLSAATRALGARDRRHAARLLIEFEAKSASQLSQLRSPGVSDPPDFDILALSEPQTVMVREMGDGADQSAPSTIALGWASALGELIKTSLLAKISLSIALAVGVVIVSAGVGSIASQLQDRWERTLGNGDR